MTERNSHWFFGDMAIIFRGEGGLFYRPSGREIEAVDFDHLEPADGMTERIFEHWLWNDPQRAAAIFRRVEDLLSAIQNEQASTAEQVH